MSRVLRSWGFSMGNKGMVMVGAVLEIVFMLMALDSVHADRIRPTQPGIKTINLMPRACV